MSHFIHPLDVLPAAGFYLAHGDDAGDPLGPMELNAIGAEYAFDPEAGAHRLWFEHRDGIFIERSDPENPGTITVLGTLELSQPPYVQNLTLLRTDYSEGGSQLWCLAPFHSDFSGSWQLVQQIPNDDKTPIWQQYLCAIDASARVLDHQSILQPLSSLTAGDALLTLNNGIKPITQIWKLKPEDFTILGAVFCEAAEGAFGGNTAFTAHPNQRFFDYQRRHSASHTPSHLIPLKDIGSAVLPPGEVVIIALETPELILIEGVAMETLGAEPEIRALLRKS